MQSLYVSNSGVSNTSVSALGSSVTVYFNPPIKLDTKKKYQIRCLSAAIVYCTPNISATKRNNILSYSKGGTNYTITFADGLYALQDINTVISLSTFSQVNDSNLIQFYPNEATSSIYVYFDQANVSINCGATNSIMQILGYPASTGVIGNFSGSGYCEGTQPANLNSLQNILISSDISTGSYLNSQNSSIIGSVIPNCVPNATIIYAPYHPLRCPLINIDKIEQMTITLTYQNNTPLDMGTSNGTLSPQLFSVLMDISPIEMANLL